VAPVTVGRNAYIGTGATIREDVPADALAVSAGKQRNIENWVTERKKRKKN
jgi:bifunctional UDP-N-acetylglucosamine pyrophosphorylase / glucosamine-1-phosphate N-acetyltransferase